tara:strand:- start:231 stop:1130 length:900 start_codon:yes stop_codon:yes gene_type:complete
MSFIHKNINLVSSKNINLLARKNINSLPGKTILRDTLIYSSKSYQESIKPFNGIELGIPLNIISNSYINLYYGHFMINISMVFLQILLGYFVYGRDRYKDAIENEHTMDISDKKELYDVIINNKNQYLFTHTTAFLCIMYIFLNNDYWIYNLPFISLLISTEFYKVFKEKYGVLKPIYISIMWTICTLIMPVVINDHNYDILLHPVNYLPIFFSLFSSSNIADIKDIEEDKLNNIETIPVKFGVKKSIEMSLIGLALSSFLIGINENYYESPIINSLLEIQNIATVIYLIPNILNITKY